MIEIRKSHLTVARSRNLRGIRDYARKAKGASLVQEGRRLCVRFDDGAYAETEFADALVLSNWIRARVARRGWFRRG